MTGEAVVIQKTFDHWFPKTIIPGVSPENLIGVKVRRIVLL